MERRTFLALAAGSLVFRRVGAAAPLVRVYKSPTCACCVAWAEHLRGNGFRMSMPLGFLIAAVLCAPASLLAQGKTRELLPATSLAQGKAHEFRSAPMLAQTGTHESHHASEASGEVMTDGEIRKVDKAQGKLTIRHGPIENLDMPSMTMVFQAKDPALLDQVKVGDKVRFHVEKEGAAYVVTRLERAR